jgi:hypothetical protein
MTGMLPVRWHQSLTQRGQPAPRTTKKKSDAKESTDSAKSGTDGQGRVTPGADVVVVTTVHPSTSPKEANTNSYDTPAVDPEEYERLTSQVSTLLQKVDAKDERMERLKKTVHRVREKMRTKLRKIEILEANTTATLGVTEATLQARVKNFKTHVQNVLRENDVDPGTAEIIVRDVMAACGDLVSSPLHSPLSLLLCLPQTLFLPMKARSMNSKETLHKKLLVIRLALDNCGVSETSATTILATMDTVGSAFSPPLP